MVVINLVLGICEYNVLFYHVLFILQRTDLIHCVCLKCFGRL